jgi:DNA-binding transcriptional LysR family regulator
MARQTLTLRQIEVVRAVMVMGTLAGAAKLLNVSAPGLSRLIKYTERSLEFPLFERKQGRLIPTPQSRAVSEQINLIYSKIEDLRYLIQRVENGAAQELKIASVPSISHVMLPRAIEQVRRLHPDLRIEISILRTDEALDYLLLDKGELVAMSCRVEHPGIQYERLSGGRLMCIVPEGHELAEHACVALSEIVRFPLIGYDPNDPYGRIMSDIFYANNLFYDVVIRARFGATVCSLVKSGLGVAVIDEFTVAHGGITGVKTIRIKEATPFETWIASKIGGQRSVFAQNFVRRLRAEMQSLLVEDGNRIDTERG